MLRLVWFSYVVSFEAAILILMLFSAMLFSGFPFFTIKCPSTVVALIWSVYYWWTLLCGMGKIDQLYQAKNSL